MYSHIHISAASSIKFQMCTTMYHLCMNNPYFWKGIHSGSQTNMRHAPNTSSNLHNLWHLHEYFIFSQEYIKQTHKFCSKCQQESKRTQQFNIFYMQTIYPKHPSYLSPKITVSSCNQFNRLVSQPK